LQLFENEFCRLPVDRLFPDKGTEPVEEPAIFPERGDIDEPERAAEHVIDVAATGGDMHDAGPFARDDGRLPFGIAAAVHDAVTRHAGAVGERVVLRETAWPLLCVEVIERTAVLPAEHRLALNRFENFVAALFLEDL